MILLLMPNGNTTAKSLAETKAYYAEYGIFVEVNSKDEWDLMSTPDDV
jgi:hypothetical protein